jgi:hypothetical protein
MRRVRGRVLQRRQRPTVKIGFGPSESAAWDDRGRVLGDPLEPLQAAGLVTTGVTPGVAPHAPPSRYVAEACLHDSDRRCQIAMFQGPTLGGEPLRTWPPCPPPAPPGLLASHRLRPAGNPGCARHRVGVYPPRPSAQSHPPWPGVQNRTAPPSGPPTSRSRAQEPAPSPSPGA